MKIINLFVIGIIFCCLVILLYLIHKKNVQIQSLSYENLENRSKLAGAINTIGFYYREGFGQRKRINCRLDSVYNANDAPIFVYRFTNYMCDECVEKQLGLIKEFESNHDDMKLLLIGDFQSKEKIEEFKHELQINSQVLSIPNLGIFEENIGNSYYFILDQNMGFSCVFFPVNGIDRLTIEYFMYIKSTFL